MHILYIAYYVIYMYYNALYSLDLNPYCMLEPPCIYMYALLHLHDYNIIIYNNVCIYMYMDP